MPTQPSSKNVVLLLIVGLHRITKINYKIREEGLVQATVTVYSTKLDGCLTVY